VTLAPGTHRLGPADGTLSVRTGRAGAVARAGHDLLIEVTAWEATLDVGDDTRIELSADPRSLRVREGSGGLQTLGADDIATIEERIDDEVLRGRPIAFRSTSVRAIDAALAVEGELTLAGATRAIRFQLSVVDDERLHAVAVVAQTEFGIKPYSALFGGLKVADDVTVEFDAALPPPR
jgi:hypothetical protein